MRRKVVWLVVVAGVGLILSITTTLTWAQTPVAPPDVSPTPVATVVTTPTPVTTQIPIHISGQIFAWYFDPEGPNILLGVVYFLLGCTGALVTVYLFLGEFLPSMGGKTEYRLTKIELEEFKKRREDALSARERFAIGRNEPGFTMDHLMAEEKITEHLNQTIESLEKRLWRERWRLFMLGFPMYVLLGGFFALAFATNMLQAILVGFSWTAVAEYVGLQKEQAAEKAIRDKAIGEMEEETDRADKLEFELAKLKVELANKEKENEGLRVNLELISEALSKGGESDGGGGTI